MSYPVPKLVLAPMEGVTDAPMRHILTQFGGIDLCVSEFLRVTTSLHSKRVFLRWCPEILNGGVTESGVKVFIQLLGGDASVLADNAARAAELGAPGVDLNFGCPAKTVNRHDGGAALLKSPDRIFKIVEAVRAAVPAHIPVTAKMRLGFDHTNDSLTLAQAIESANANWVTVHARTKVDGYKPPAYWEKIALIKEKIKIPVIANGEVWTKENYDACLRQSNCDHVMIGRGILRNPYLFSEIRGFETVNTKDALSLLMTFFEYCCKWKSPYFAQARTKQWLRQLAFVDVEASNLFDVLKVLTKPILFEQKLRELAVCRQNPDLSAFKYNFDAIQN